MKSLMILFMLFFSQSALAIEAYIPDIAAPQNSNSPQSVTNWINNFYQFALIGGVFLAVGVITWAGFRYALAAGNPSTQSDARDQILQALLGLILLFGAFLILYAVNPGLVNLELEGLNNVYVPGGNNGGGGIGTGSSTYTGGGGEFGGGGAGGNWGGLTDAQVRQIFGQNNIGIKSGAGAAVVDGLQQSIVNAVVDLKRNCNCNITITEGTGNHPQDNPAATYTHTHGYKVDIRLDASLDSYITNNFTYVGVRSDGAAQYLAPNGAVYAREHNHWDVVSRS